MVRSNANHNEPSDNKKETTTKKRSAPRKKTVVTGVWPCKINGCNKQFAREADLKRHQRTTKLHSMPSFACPQCDATFTRTDALRRHQKSRHNGIVIEPSEKDDAEDDGSSGTRSKSRSATPSSKGKEKEHPLPAPYAAPVTTRTGPSSYYRQHTLTTSPYVPRQVSMGPNYAQSGLPTSATRLNLATHWGYPHPWPDGATAPQQISYQHMYYASHYRPNGSTQPPGSIPPPPPPYSNVTQQHLPPAPCSPPGTQDTKHPTSTDITNNASVSAPSIDPSLDANESTELTPEQIMQITKALLQEQGELESSSAESRDDSTSTTAFSETDRRTGSGSQDERDANEGKAHAIHGYGLPLERPEPMEHMLTEDGEPMLNPAELLTQESLASPPPS